MAYPDAEISFVVITLAIEVNVEISAKYKQQQIESNILSLFIMCFLFAVFHNSFYG